VRATLEFDLPEDQQEFEVAIHAMGWALVVWDLNEWLRSRVKYGGEEDKVNTYQNVRDELQNILDNHGVSLEDVE
jgi:hypothetical protein